MSKPTSLKQFFKHRKQEEFLFSTYYLSPEDTNRLFKQQQASAINAQKRTQNK